MSKMAYHNADYVLFRALFLGFCTVFNLILRNNTFWKGNFVAKGW